MSKKQIILSKCDSQYSSYSDFVFPYLDQIGLNNYECYLFYYCLNGHGTNYMELSKINYQSDLVIWVAEDTLSESINDIQGPTKEYNWYSDKKPEALLYLERICRMYPEKKFILMTEQYKMNDLCTTNNLKFVDLTPYCFRFDRNKYKYDICLKKSDSSGKNWMFLNGTARIHRILILSYILSKNINKFGHISVSSQIFKKIEPHKKIYSLNKTVFQFDIKTALKLNEGYTILKNKYFEVIKIVPYFQMKYLNIDNYNNNLIEFYEKTKLELISSTTFSEPTICFSEKEYQCFYGRNFFIYFGSFGSIQYLREWGFDVFDDVIDHSYDLIEDPSERLIKSIDNNIHLIDGSTNLDKLWEDREERFNKNCLVADNIQEKLDIECKKQILERLNEYSIPYKKTT